METDMCISGTHKYMEVIVDLLQKLHELCIRLVIWTNVDMRFCHNTVYH